MEKNKWCKVMDDKKITLDISDNEYNVWYYYEYDEETGEFVRVDMVDMEDIDEI